MKKIAFFLWIFAFHFVQAEPAADLNALLGRFSSLEAHFSVSSPANLRAGESKGVLMIAKPNRFNYHVFTPNAELFISDGKQVWSVEPDLQQVTISPLVDSLSTTPLLLLSNQKQDIKRIFKVKQTDALHYELKPKGQDTLIQQIVLGFTKEGVLDSLSITNTLGETRVLRFTEVRLNQAINPSFFHYIPGPNMDVLS